MNHGYLKQSTASQQVLIGPFVDDTDFKTVETGLTIANTDINLSKNGAATASKNSGGGTHRSNGMYAITLDATDTNTVGELAGMVNVTGALVVVFKFTVLEEAIYDALFASAADGFDADGRVDIGEWAGTSVSSGNAAIATPPTNWDDLVISTAGNANSNVQINSDKTDYQLADDAITASKYDETTAFPVASVDSGATQIARTGADGDTLETLSDQIDTVPTVSEIRTEMETDGGDLSSLMEALVNQRIWTEASGDLEMFNDSGVSQGTITAQVTSDGTYTTAKRAVI